MNKQLEERAMKLGQLMILISGIVGFLFAAGWKLYAEDKVDLQISVQTSPIEDKVDENTHKIEQIEFMGKQTLVLLKKVATKKDVREMEEETEMFRPKKGHHD